MHRENPIPHDNPTSELYGLEFKESIERWDEAIPLGNGTIGCLVWGNGSPLRFSLDRSDLWDKRPASVWKQPYANYKEIIRLVKERNSSKINDMYTTPFFEPTPTKIPAGRIEINYARQCDSMRSSLKLANAIAHFELVFGAEKSDIYTYVSANEPCGFISIRGKLPQVDLIPHNFTKQDNSSPEKSITGTQQSSLDYPPAEMGNDGKFIWFRQKTAEDLEFAVLCCLKRVSSNRRDLAYTVASSESGTGWFEVARQKLEVLMDLGYQKAADDHADWWSSFWKASAIDIPNKEFERQWYLTNYLFGSSSRKKSVPISLQAVWTADEGCLPPWKGEYASDLNLQMSYWHALKANHVPEHECLTDFLWDRMPAAELFASNFFDAPGICFPGAMTVDAEPVGGWAMYVLSITSSAWLSQAFDHYWLYTGDVGFLRDRAYPFLKKSAECILHWLSPGEDGKLYLPVSSSPEIHDDTMDSWLTPNSNYDLSIMIYLFSRLMDMADKLGNGEADYWQNKLDLLPELSVDEQAGLMLSPDEVLQHSHRHHSHTLAIYPFNILDYTGSASDRAIIDRTVHHLEHLGTGQWEGYSFPWLACLYAIQGNGEGAAHQLDLFWKCFCSKNGFHMNGDFKKCGSSADHSRIFTLEGNMGAAAALQEMLLQSRDNKIQVFPAIPKAWKDSKTAFRNLRAEGGVLVSACLEYHKLQYVELESQYGSSVNVRNDFESSELTVKTEISDYVVQCKTGDLIQLELKAGVVYTLSANE